jgi:hypothetical protein
MLASVSPRAILCERGTLEVFAKSRYAASYRHWRREDLTQTALPFDFEKVFEEVATNVGIPHFHLDGMDLRRAWRQGQYHYLDPKGGYTIWQFRQTLTRTELHAKTSFWQNGQQVPMSWVLARTGAIP